MKKFMQILRDFYLWYTWDKRYAGFYKKIFNSFDEAYRFLKSKNKKIGYNDESVINKYLSNINERQPIRDYEYPCFFWLFKIHIELTERKNVMKVFDFGGNFGTHFFKYSRVTYNNNYIWIICEAEKLVEKAKEVIKNSNLKFTTDFQDCEGCNVFFSIGAIQYVPSLSLSTKN